MLFDIVNLPYWIFLGMGVLLYLVVILSGGGEDDLEVDADADFDIDADADIDTSSDFSFLEVLGWLGFGKAPLILLLATDFSLLGLIGWMLNVAFASITGDTPIGLTVGVISGLSLFLSLAIGSFIARPIGKVFASFGEDASGDRLIGCQGTVSSLAIPTENQGKIGQVDVLDPARNLVTVNATLPSWANVIPGRGTQVLVIDRRPHSYLVIAKDSSDEQQWLATSSPTKGE
ncbi:MAG: DUF1449 domain-containing protein [Cyanobacteriota bacterium]